MISEYDKRSPRGITPPHSSSSPATTQTENIFSIYSALFGSDLIFQPLSRILYAQTLHHLPGTVLRLTPTASAAPPSQSLTRGLSPAGATARCSFILMNQDANTLSLKMMQKPTKRPTLNHLFLPPCISRALIQ